MHPTTLPYQVPTPSFKAPCYRKSDYSIHSLQFADHPLDLEEDLHQMTGFNRPTSVQVSDTKLAYVETEIRRCLKSLSLMALTSKAIIQDPSEDNPQTTSPPSCITFSDRWSTCILTCKLHWWNSRPRVAWAT